MSWKPYERITHASIAGDVPVLCLVEMLILSIRAGGKVRDMRYVNFENRDISHLDLSHCDLRGARMVNVNATGTNFRGADLRGVCFVDCCLNGATFYGADLDQSKMRSCKVVDTDLRTVDHGGTDFRYTDWEDSMNWEFLNRECDNALRTELRAEMEAERALL